MSEDKFDAAGRAFQSKQASDFSARDQALTRLQEIHALCQGGVTRFYNAAGLGKPDVYVDMPNEQQIRISYGFRYGRNGKITRGPLGSVFVTPEGKILLGSDLRWKDPDSVPPAMIGTALEAEDWQNVFSDWLTDFLTQSERLYESPRY